jgi:hypothetical protein
MPTGAAIVAGGKGTWPAGYPEEGTLGALESVANPPRTTKRGRMILRASTTCTAIRRGGLGRGREPTGVGAPQFEAGIGQAAPGFLRAHRHLLRALPEDVFSHGLVAAVPAGPDVLIARGGPMGDRPASAGALAMGEAGAGDTEAAVGARAAPWPGARAVRNGQWGRAEGRRPSEHDYLSMAP